MKATLIFVGSMLIACSAPSQRPSSQAPDALPIEATSLDGRPLVRPALPADVQAEYERKLGSALADYEREPSADHLVWVGRRLGYLGRYREAIGRFSEGVAAFPRDARFLRHRGHRYLTTREIDKAVRDFEAAAESIAGTEDEIEPDGLPNARGIPTSTLHTNIYYHLGLAHYLRGDNAAARAAWQKCLAASRNPDMEVATQEEADALLEDLLAGSQWASFGYLAAEADGTRTEP